jgi:hypothetical protein
VEFEAHENDVDVKQQQKTDSKWQALFAAVSDAMYAVGGKG